MTDNIQKEAQELYPDRVNNDLGQAFIEAYRECYIRGRKKTIEENERLRLLLKELFIESCQRDNLKLGQTDQLFRAWQQFKKDNGL